MPLSVFFELFSCVRLSATSWTAACQTSVSFTISSSMLKFMSIELVISSSPWDSDSEESARSAGDTGLMIPGLGRFFGKQFSCILTWRISWTEEPGGLQYMGLKESDISERLTLSLI